MSRATAKAKSIDLQKPRAQQMALGASAALALLAALLLISP
jgi:hypothetical protein